MFDLATAQHDFVHQVDKFARMGRGGSTELVAFEDGRLILSHCTSHEALNGPIGKRNMRTHLETKLHNMRRYVPEVTSLEIRYSISGEPLGYTRALDEVITRCLKLGAETLRQRCDKLRSAYGLSKGERFETQTVGVIRASVTRDTAGAYVVQLPTAIGSSSLKDWVAAQQLDA